MRYTQWSRKDGVHASPDPEVEPTSPKTQTEARNAAHVALKKTDDPTTSELEASHAALLWLNRTDAGHGFAAPEALAQRIRYTNEALASAPAIEQQMIEQESQHASHDEVIQPRADAGGRERS